jgi:hypothetical protein
LASWLLVAPQIEALRRCVDAASPNGVARDFARQCDERLVALDFDLLCSTLDLDFWRRCPNEPVPWSMSYASSPMSANGTETL